MNDIDILPQYLKDRSISNKEIILSFYDALEAIKILSDNSWSILGWEALIKHSDGKYGHPPVVIGSNIQKRGHESWKTYVQSAARFCKETMEKEKYRWEQSSIEPSSNYELYFCITAMSENN